jgi:hypothetical protein
MDDEAAYRQLRIIFAGHSDRDSEGQFYAHEKRSQRLGLKWSTGESISRVVSRLYDLMSEYGSSYERAFVAFFIVQAFFLLIYAGLSDRWHVVGGEYDSKVVAFTFAQVVKPFELFSVKFPLDGAYTIVGDGCRGWWELLTLVQSVASISLIALFLLALRWRFRRE